MSNISYTSLHGVGKILIDPQVACNGSNTQFRVVRFYDENNKLFHEVTCHTVNHNAIKLVASAHFFDNIEEE